MRAPHEQALPGMRLTREADGPPHLGSLTVRSGWAVPTQCMAVFSMIPNAAHIRSRPSSRTVTGVPPQCGDLAQRVGTPAADRVLSWRLLLTWRSYARRAAANGGPGTVNGWRRSSSWPPRAAPSGNYHRCSGGPGPPPTGVSPSGAGSGAGPGCTAWSSTNSASGGELDWSRCAIDSVSVRAAKGATDRTESDRPRQERSKIHLITDRNGAGHLRRQRARQPRPGAAGARDPAHPFIRFRRGPRRVMPLAVV